MKTIQVSDETWGVLDEIRHRTRESIGSIVGRLVAGDRSSVGTVAEKKSESGRAVRAGLSGSADGLLPAGIRPGQELLPEARGKVQVVRSAAEGGIPREPPHGIDTVDRPPDDQPIRDTVYEPDEDF